MKSRIKAYAKVNLFLDITGKLENGYHTLNTVMQQINLYDVIDIEISNGEGIFIKCDNPLVPCNEKNIAYKAAEAFISATNKNAKINISINKNIPIEAGLGGSSTDGAAVLNVLNELYGYVLPHKELYGIGKKLGADVPFCLHGGTAICNGIGEKITPINCQKNYVIAIVKPEFSCSTPVGFKTYDSNPIPINDDFSEFVELLPYGAEKWAKKMYNIFEVLYEDKRINEITAAMKRSGAIGSILTGSGSAVIGIFADTISAEKSLKTINAPFKILTNAI